MKYSIIIGFAAVMMLGCDHVDGLDEDVGSDVDTGSDTDIDTDTGTDTDTDIGADTDTDIGTNTDECTASEGITDWGGPCHSNADCPDSTECIILTILDDPQGFCAAECCNLTTADPAYCTDVAGGQESCNISFLSDEGIIWEPPFYCVILCNTPADCPTGTDCMDPFDVGLTICHGYAS